VSHDLGINGGHYAAVAADHVAAVFSLRGVPLAVGAVVRIAGIKTVGSDIVSFQIDPHDRADGEAAGGRRQTRGHQHARSAKACGRNSSWTSDPHSLQ